MTHSQAVTGPRLFSGSSTFLCLLLSLSPPTHSLTHSSDERPSGRGKSDHDDKKKPWPALLWLVDLSCVISATVTESLPHFSPPLPPPLVLSEAVFQRGYLLLTERRGLTQPLISSAYRCSDRQTEELLSHTLLHLTVFPFHSPVQDSMLLF